MGRIRSESTQEIFKKYAERVNASGCTKLIELSEEHKTQIMLNHYGSVAKEARRAVGIMQLRQK